MQNRWQCSSDASGNHLLHSVLTAQAQVLLKSELLSSSGSKPSSERDYNRSHKYVSSGLRNSGTQQQVGSRDLRELRMTVYEVGSRASYLCELEQIDVENRAQLRLIPPPLILTSIGSVALMGMNADRRGFSTPHSPELAHGVHARKPLRRTSW